MSNSVDSSGLKKQSFVSSSHVQVSDFSCNKQ